MGDAGHVRGPLREWKPMRKPAAVAGSAVFLVIAPGVVAGLVPWWLTGWRMGASYPLPVQVTGAALTVAGAVVLLGAFAQFALEGRGTPAPPAPTGQLVVRGLYRYVRNPMYLAVLTVITGQALMLGRPALFGYAAVVAAAFAAFVYGYEQPALARRYGAQYETYRRAVPGWWPRLPPARRIPRP
jgi:protein-S-isoprenylcysteine O-methyltransferase Ste14